MPIINTTIENNIKYGCAKKVGEQEVIEAAKQANILRFIELLPEKLKTVVGENGIRLSRGQKQRIAIARALLANREVILLDEATSSLDYGQRDTYSPDTGQGKEDNGDNSAQSVYSTTSRYHIISQRWESD